jgi:hypothetical protein
VTFFGKILVMINLALSLLLALGGWVFTQPAPTGRARTARRTR